MKEGVRPLSRITLVLLSNGDLSALETQETYEWCWADGTRPLNEYRLKPAVWLKKKHERRRIPV